MRTEDSGPLFDKPEDFKGLRVSLEIVSEVLDEGHAIPMKSRRMYADVIRRGIAAMDALLKSREVKP